MTQHLHVKESADAEKAARQVKAALVKEALEDPEFRRLALRDPAAAVRRSRFVSDAERALAAGFEVSVVEETAERVYLVVPAAAAHEQTDPDDPRSVLLAHAHADEDYLERLTTDPRSVIEAEFLVELPPEVQVQVLRETAQRRFAVVPADLRPGQATGAREQLAEFRAKGWGSPSPGPGGPSGPPADTLFQSPTCPSQTKPM